LAQPFHAVGQLLQLGVAPGDAAAADVDHRVGEHTLARIVGGVAHGFEALALIVEQVAHVEREVARQLLAPQQRARQVAERAEA
jgi:hypothetical protein